MPKYSIIIPTYDNLDSCLKPCLESILMYTSTDDFEIIVVANGCTDGTEEYVRQLSNNRDRGTVKLLSYPDPLGYTRAINTGLGVATGEYVVLLNNDTKILDFGANWLEMLSAPFSDPFVGITGPSVLYSEEARDHFMIFFCAMVPRRIFFEIGYLDETFNPGAQEDVDFCMRLKKAGYKMVRVPDDGTDWSYRTNFPIYHAGEMTVHTKVDGWEDKFWARAKIIKDRTDRGYYSNFADVTCEISTKGRYTTTLPLAIMSVIQQELKPKKLIIFQDDFNPGLKDKPWMLSEKNDMSSMEVYRHLFNLLSEAGIEWAVIYGTGDGQVTNHQRALEMSDTEWVWRLDDDNFAEADVLRKLMECTGDGVGAVAPSCVEPGRTHTGRWSTKIEHINTHGNVQWAGKPGPGEPALVPAEHLYSTFVYRRSAAQHGYKVLELSKVGHREETIFTYEMFRNGHNLLVNRDAMVWHLRGQSGGIRSHVDAALWASDEAFFNGLLELWGVADKSTLYVNLDCGRGDHYVFLMALDEIKTNNPNKEIVVFSAHPEWLSGIDGLDVMSVADGHLLGPKFDELNIYRWCMQNAWNGPLSKAFVELYK